MGGLQTLTLSLTHSDLFSYIGVFSSGWFPPMREQVEKTDFPQYKANGHPHMCHGRYSILSKQLHSWPAVGFGDAQFSNCDPVEFESEGFHAWNNWRDYLNLFAPQLFR